MDKLISNFVELFNTHFDLSFMLCVNILTYILIKVIDDLMVIKLLALGLNGLL